MIEGDWLSLVCTNSLYSELTVVAQPRKLYRLGLSFLERVRDRLPTSSDHVALEVTADYVAGKARLLALVEAWTTAELDGGEGVWSPEDWWCDCCCAAPEDWPYLPGALNYARHPSAFAAHAAYVGLRLAGGFYQHRLYTVNEAVRGYPERMPWESSHFGRFGIFELRISGVRIGLEAARHA